MPVSTDWKIGYVLSWVRNFGVEVNLRSIIAVMPPITGALIRPSIYDSVLKAAPAPGFAQLVERIQELVRARSILIRDIFIIQEPTTLSCGYLIGDVMES